MAPFAQLRATPEDPFDVAADGVNARADAAAIRFELRLAGPSGPDAAAEPRERVARADEPRQQVFQLREFHLQLAFARPRAAREDVEDELRAIDDFAMNFRLVRRHIGKCVAGSTTACSCCSRHRCLSHGSIFDRSFLRHMCPGNWRSRRRFGMQRMLRRVRGERIHHRGGGLGSHRRGRFHFFR